MTTAQGGRPHDADGGGSGLDAETTALGPADPTPSSLSAPRLALRRITGAGPTTSPPVRRGRARPASAVETSPPRTDPTIPPRADPTTPPRGRAPSASAAETTPPRAVSRPAPSAAATTPPAVPGQRARPTVSGPTPSLAGRFAPPLSRPPGGASSPPVPPPGRAPSAGAGPVRPVTPPVAAKASRPLLGRARSWAARPTTRRSAVGAACLLSVGVLTGALGYWLAGPSSGAQVATIAPVAWVGVVHDVGAAGVNLRSAPEVFPATSRNTAHRGAQLQIVCALTGDVVGKGAARTATWLKTADGLYVSLLYVRVEGKQNIASCADDRRLPLVSLADPRTASASPSGDDLLASGGGRRTTSLGVGSATVSGGGGATGNSGGATGNGGSSDAAPANTTVPSGDSTKPTTVAPTTTATPTVSSSPGSEPGDGDASHGTFDPTTQTPSLTWSKAPLEVSPWPGTPHLSPTSPPSTDAPPDVQHAPLEPDPDVVPVG